jgi:hypothetical protein
MDHTGAFSEDGVIRHVLGPGSGGGPHAGLTTLGSDPVGVDASWDVQLGRGGHILGSAGELEVGIEDGGRHVEAGVLATDQGGVVCDAPERGGWGGHHLRGVKQSREIRDRADRRDASIPWAILLPFLLELIKLWIERRQS